MSFVRARGGESLAARRRVRTVAAIPAVGLLAGAAAGLLRSSFLPSFPSCNPDFCNPDVLRRLVAVGMAAERHALLAAAVVAGFFAGGALLAADAWHARGGRRCGSRSRRSRARSGAMPTAGRRLPEDDEAFAVVEGVLRADAAPTPSGVSLSVDVDG